MRNISWIARWFISVFLWSICLWLREESIEGLRCIVDISLIVPELLRFFVDDRFGPVIDLLRRWFYGH